MDNQLSGILWQGGGGGGATTEQQFKSVIIGLKGCIDAKLVHIPMNTEVDLSQLCVLYMTQLLS